MEHNTIKKSLPERRKSGSPMDIQGESNEIVIYSIPVCVFLGFQYLISSSLSLVHYPLKAFPAYCLLPDDIARGVQLSNILFWAGLGTVIQSLSGVRVPLMMVPSFLFISSMSQITENQSWEQYSDGDLYAMGQDLRNKEFIQRRNEMQGIVIISSIGSSIISFFFWYFKINLPSLTISATIITACVVQTFYSLSEISNLEQPSSIFALLPLALVLFFYTIHNVKVPFLKVIANEDNRMKLKLFRIFGVLFAFMISVYLCQNVAQEFENTLRRAVEPQNWLSFGIIPQEFNAPNLTIRSTQLIPGFLSQILTSYCLYALISENEERKLTGIICENSINFLSPLLGNAFPISIDPSSVGLYYLTMVKSNEASVISGSLLIVVSAFLQLLRLYSYVPFLVLFGISAFLHSQAICKAISKKTQITKEGLNIVCTSIFSALLMSYLMPEMNENNFYHVLSIVIKNPILMTFGISLVLQLSV